MKHNAPKLLVVCSMLICGTLTFFSSQGFADPIPASQLTGLWKFEINERDRLFRPGPSRDRLTRDKKHKIEWIAICFVDDKTWYSPNSSREGAWETKADRIMMRGNYISEGYQGGGNIAAILQPIARLVMSGNWIVWSDYSRRPGMFGYVVAKKLSKSCERGMLDIEPPRQRIPLGGQRP